jgi:hypothetical protein
MQSSFLANGDRKYLFHLNAISDLHIGDSGIGTFAKESRERRSHLRCSSQLSVRGLSYGFDSRRRRKGQRWNEETCIYCCGFLLILCECMDFAALETSCIDLLGEHNTTGDDGFNAVPRPMEPTW